MQHYLSKDWSNQLKGIAIVLVILSHLQLINHAGTWGVGLFLILSGFGLTQSYQKSGIDAFFQKRVSKVLIPYFIVTLIWIIVDAFLGMKHSMFSTILALIGVNLNEEIDKSMWYITYILIWYAIFYITFRIIKNNSIKVITLFLFSVVLYKTSFIFPQAVGVDLYFLYFPIGVLLSLLYKKIIAVKLKYLKIGHIVLTIGCFAIFSVLYTQFNSYSIYFLESMFFAIGSISLFGLLSLYSIKIKIIEFVGIISFEIYLFEFVFISNYKFIFNLSLNIWVERLLYVILVVCLSILLKKLIELMNGVKIKNKSKSLAH